jgi:riboflavin kinase/FMN adenylyltransferase
MQEPVSSSRIRAALTKGELDKANRLLGYHWIVEGIVIEGDKRGRELGYPTANFKLPDNSKLAQGIYAVRLKLGDRLLDGGASFGKPMFDNTQPPFEVHIFDFDEDIYGEKLEVALINHIRGQMTFDGIDELIQQMDADSIKARAALIDVPALSDLDQELGFITKG